MRIVLDTAILVRAHDGAKGLSRDLLLRVIESDHVPPISDEMLYELAKVLRYPRMVTLHGLSEGRIYDYIGSLREATEIVHPNPSLITPIRDMNDTVVMQTAVIGEAEILCTRDQDSFYPPAEPFLRRARIDYRRTKARPDAAKVLGAVSQRRIHPRRLPQYLPLPRKALNKNSLFINSLAAHTPIVDLSL